MAMITVKIDESRVLTLDDIAKAYGKSYAVRAKPNYEKNQVDFMTDDGIEASVDESGFAYKKDGSWFHEYDTNWAEDVFDTTDLIWAKDENGHVVALVGN